MRGLKLGRVGEMEKRVRVWGAAVGSSIALHMNPSPFRVSVTVSRIFSILPSQWR